jgi:acetylornithine deacetylase/succinyl-diaminopimelate desuccinylase-like protein
VGIRTVPDMVASDVAKKLQAHLEADPPWNARVKTEVKALGDWWFTTPQGSAFAAVERSLKRGFGRDAVYIGCGGSIPFVEPFAEALDGAPALLIGLEDPICNAHSENESLLLSDFVKAINSVIYLYDELKTPAG